MDGMGLKRVGSWKMVSAFANPGLNTSLAKYHELTTVDVKADATVYPVTTTNGKTGYMLLHVVPASVDDAPSYTAVPLADFPRSEMRTALLPAMATARSTMEVACSKASVAGIAAALLYGTVAVAMNFVNKWTMELFPLANFVLVLQMLFTLAILQPLVALRHLPFQPFSWSRARQLALLCQLYTANTAFALYGLRTLNVPMYSTLKRLTPMVVLATKSILQRKLPNRSIAFAVSLVVMGTVVAGAADLSFDLAGYSFALASVASQAAYLILTEYHAAEGVPTSELLYYNSITSLPTLLFIMLATGEAARLPSALAASFQHFGYTQVIFALSACSVFGALLNYSLFLCTTTNSALTTTIVGVLKGVVAVVLGFFILGGAPIHPVNIAGIALNTMGGIMYTVHKFRTRSAQRTAEVARSILASPSMDSIQYYSSGSWPSPAASPVPRKPGSTGAVQRRNPSVSSMPTTPPAPQQQDDPLVRWACWGPRRLSRDSDLLSPLLPRPVLT